MRQWIFGFKWTYNAQNCFFLEFFHFLKQWSFLILFQHLYVFLLWLWFLLLLRRGSQRHNSVCKRVALGIALTFFKHFNYSCRLRHWFCTYLNHECSMYVSSSKNFSNTSHVLKLLLTYDPNGTSIGIKFQNKINLKSILIGLETFFAPWSTIYIYLFIYLHLMGFFAIYWRFITSLLFKVATSWNSW